MYIFIGTFCLFITLIACDTFSYEDRFNEDLLVKPLPSGHVYAQFRFLVEKDIDEDNHAFKHFRLFPRSLGEIISKHSVQELHFCLTQGLWRYEKWGYPFRSAPPGAELWAWFKKDTEDVTSTWKNLVNVLSGQFCASLNFIDHTNTVAPKLSFRPLGAVVSDEAYNSSYVRYASLPPEIVCTENLTPFKKLLPCDTKAGLSVLLNAINIFDAHFISLAVDLRTVCKVPDCSAVALEMVQSVSVVFDPPVQQNGKQDWSFVKLFGSGLTSSCPVAVSSKVYVDISSNNTGIPFKLTPVPLEPTEIVEDEAANNENFAIYDLKEVLTKNRQLNVAALYQKTHIYWLIPPPMIYGNRYITGYGQENGGIHCTIYNSHPSKTLKVLYLDVIPWFLRIYSHTLTIKNRGKIIVPDYKYFETAKDRERPHHLEVVFALPPNSATEISIEFDHALLKWTEYPPDANHGFYVGSAVLSALLDSDQNFTYFPTFMKNDPMAKYFLRLHTQILLVSLPTPDFSMPYNVICLACTVVALAFGPIHNITTKILDPIDDDVESWFSKLKVKLREYKEKFKDRFFSEAKKQDIITDSSEYDDYDEEDDYSESY